MEQGSACSAPYRTLGCAHIEIEAAEGALFNTVKSPNSTVRDIVIMAKADASSDLGVIFCCCCFIVISMVLTCQNAMNVIE
jgi:uncharacterized BrkB/YihY/UPF0761 family membrane protein